ncbi:MULTISPECIES: hypothetical protein [unclassified Uliginosibacterium]|uniref:hypothetical protein n=1 Tax=unclassified Uliginosibacterium TaxID=2621521 RepID=UPI00117F189F|nr:MULTISPECIES: hypothetical protein [unclassified Uliginosibacterium]MDO6388417.1 hypothetical protein [Uliginosibacterium sp. 31-12]
MKIRFVLYLFALGLNACALSSGNKPEEQQVQLPERFMGVNIFVATDPVKIPEKGVAMQVMPDPRKPIPYDESAASETQQMVYGFAVDLRENIEPVFRQQNVQAFSYIAGANYRWDELRKDQRNYSLVIWPTRSSLQGQEVDVRAVLVHEGSGRQVWQYTFKDPYRSRNAVLGGYTRSERLSIVRAMSEKLLTEMKLQGILVTGGV